MGEETEVDYAYPWLADGEYQKAIGQLRLQLGVVFRPFQLYGLDIFIPGAIDEIVILADAFSQRVRGKDVPIQVQGRLL